MKLGPDYFDLAMFADCLDNMTDDELDRLIQTLIEMPDNSGAKADGANA